MHVYVYVFFCYSVSDTSDDEEEEEEDEEDEDDDEEELSDHDLTPCNQSPSLSQLLNWSGTGCSSGGGGSGQQQQQQMKLLEQDEIEEAWKGHVHRVMQNASNDGLLRTFGAFEKLFKVMKNLEIKIK